MQMNLKTDKHFWKTQVSTLTEEVGVTFREVTQAHVLRAPTLVASCVTHHSFVFWQLTTETFGLHNHGEWYAQVLPVEANSP